MRSNMGPGNFGSNHSSQQNISLNMSSSNNFSLRNQQNISANISSNNMTTNNNNNLTSQHIQRLNQLSVNSQFSHEAPVEPPRLFHPPAAQMSQVGYSGEMGVLFRVYVAQRLAHAEWEMHVFPSKHRIMLWRHVSYSCDYDIQYLTHKSKTQMNLYFGVCNSPYCSVWLGYYVRYVTPQFISSLQLQLQFNCSCQFSMLSPDNQNTFD